MVQIYLSLFSLCGWCLQKLPLFSNYRDSYCFTSPENMKKNFSRSIKHSFLSRKYKYLFHFSSSQSLGHFHNFVSFSFPFCLWWQFSCFIFVLKMNYFFNSCLFLDLKRFFMHTYFFPPPWVLSVLSSVFEPIQLTEIYKNSLYFSTYLWPSIIITEVN